MKNENMGETSFRKQPAPFTQVSNGLLYNPNISFKAKGIWAYMSAKPDGWHFSATRIAEETKEDRKAILSGLKELYENGYITAKRLKTGRIEYVLHWEPITTPVSEPESKSEPEPEHDEENEAESEMVRTSMSVPPPDTNARPKRGLYATDKEYEKAFYKWNSMRYNSDA